MARIQLKHRDPRNHSHFMEAYQIIADSITIEITEKSRDDFTRDFGDDLIDSRIKVVADAEAFSAAAIIGHFFFLDIGLMFPMNKIVLCHDCRHPLEIRSESLVATTILCPFCAAERVLNKEFQDTI